MNSKWVLVNLFYAAAISGLALASPEICQGCWPRSAVLDKDKRFRMEWWPGKEEDIFFKLEVRTLGGVSIGFSKDGTMVNCDVVVGWVSNEKIYLQDKHTGTNQKPKLDRSQDWDLIKGEENSTHTTLVIRRKLNTCDSQDFAFEYDNTIRLMHGYSDFDPDDQIDIHYHSTFRSGWRSFMLLQPAFPRDTDSEFWDVMLEFTVSPEWETKYWSKIIRSPILEQKHHITAMDVRFLGGNVGYVHHMDLFECTYADPREFEPYVGMYGWDVLAKDAPDIFKRCVVPFAIWSKGGEGVVLPSHIGIPLDPNPTKYYLLVVHYDNFNRDIGTPGQAGFRLLHTPKLRQHEAGILMIGSQIGPNIMIPPGVRDFHTATHTNPECTGPAMPPEGVLVSSVLLHTHLIGRDVKQRHFRKNKELPPIAHNKNYDPDYQEHHQLVKEVRLLPWDQLTLECISDSTNRTKTTFGGFSTMEEMCLAFIIYYPKIDNLPVSATRVQKQTNVNYIGSWELDRLSRRTSKYDQSFVDYMTNYDWSRTDIRRFENGVVFSPQDTICVFENIDKSRLRTTISYPENLQYHFDPPSCSAATRRQ